MWPPVYSEYIESTSASNVAAIGFSVGSNPAAGMGSSTSTSVAASPAQAVFQGSHQKVSSAMQSHTTSPRLGMAARFPPTSSARQSPHQSPRPVQHVDLTGTSESAPSMGGCSDILGGLTESMGPGSPPTVPNLQEMNLIQAATSLGLIPVKRPPTPPSPTAATPAHTLTPTTSATPINLASPTFPARKATPPPPPPLGRDEEDMNVDDQYDEAAGGNGEGEDISDPPIIPETPSPRRIRQPSLNLLDCRLFPHC